MNLSQVDLNLLVALDALLKERNVTRAGRKLGLSQPAMSAALSRLRLLLNDPLLERVGREYRLTPIAAKLVDPLQSILASIERTLAHNAPFDPASARRSFRIAGSDYVALLLMQPLMQRLGAIAPGLKIKFQRAGQDTAKSLAERRLDLAIQPAGAHRDFESEVLFQDEWLCAVWSGNTEVGKRITREQFCSLPHAAYSHAPFGYTAADVFVGALARELRVQVMIDSFAALPMMLRGTQLVTLVQSKLGEQLQKSADIRLMKPPVPVEKLVVMMWWNRLYSDDSAHSWLRQTIADVSRLV
jgi:LysR family transcriptional regulator, nod-box dependent transcriptional activator